MVSQPQKGPRRRGQLPANALVAAMSPRELRRGAQEGMTVLKLDRSIRVEVEPGLARVRARSAQSPSPTEELSQPEVV